MAKKTKISVRRDDDLAAIDGELDTAMGALDEVNASVDELLSSYEKPESEGPEDAPASPTAPNDSGKSEETQETP